MRNDRNKQFKTRFDKDAAGYDQSPRYAWNRSRYHYAVEETLRHQFQTLLDVGCGTGALLSIIGEQRKTAQLFGVDLSDEMIGVAKAKLGDRADLKVADSEQLPFESGKFDVITCTFSFHHYPNPEAVLAEMKRVLSPGGKLLVVDPWLPTPIRQLFNLLSPLRSEGIFYSKKEMLDFCYSLGLEVHNWSRVGSHGYMLVAKKTNLSTTVNLKIDALTKLGST